MPLVLPDFGLILPQELNYLFQKRDGEFPIHQLEHELPEEDYQKRLLFLKCPKQYLIDQLFSSSYLFLRYDEIVVLFSMRL